MLFTLVSFFSHVKPATIYPPLSGLGDAQKSEELMRLVGQWNIMIWIVFLFFLLILVISALLTGINWNTPTDEIQK
jgi:disulfide bond formation protein DsbB